MPVLHSAILSLVTGQGTQFVVGAASAAAILVASSLYYVLSSEENEDEFPQLQGIQLYHAWKFPRWRHDFLRSNFQHNLGKARTISF